MATTVSGTLGTSEAQEIASLNTRMNALDNPTSGAVPALDNRLDLLDDPNTGKVTKLVSYFNTNYMFSEEIYVTNASSGSNITVNANSNLEFEFNVNSSGGGNLYPNSKVLGVVGWYAQKSGIVPYRLKAFSTNESTGSYKVQVGVNNVTSSNITTTLRVEVLILKDVNA